MNRVPLLLLCLSCLQGIHFGLTLSLRGLEEKKLQTIEDTLVNGLVQFVKTNQEPEDLKLALELVKAPKVFRSVNTEPNPPICMLCKVAARLLILYYEKDLELEDLKIAIKTLCIQSQIETETVCNGVIDLNLGIFVYIVDHKPNITVDTICSTIAQPYGCPSPPDDNNWEVEIPPFLDYKPSRMFDKNSSQPIRILQLSDLHYDELYAEGTNALCNEPLCCGTNQEDPATPEAKAGYWGDYRSCDMPWYSIENLLQQAQTHKYDYIYFTGDIINHRVWATSIENNVKNIKKVFNEFRKTFGSTPIYPILGNHEPNPLNEFAQQKVKAPEYTTQWLYDFVAEEWSDWLPQSARDTIKMGGFYTVLVRPGFRIIALNSNIAYVYNWWLLYDHSMLHDQLQWLTDTLFEAEKNGEIVHILSHVPTGDSTCLIKWSREYNKIIERFSHIIAAQFVGHTHSDELNLFFKNNDINQPINVAFNGGSFTSYVDVNPNYVIYEINPVTYEVENYDEWIYNLTDANLKAYESPPKWFKLYSFKEAYGLESLKLKQLSNLVQTMATNQTLLTQYFRYKIREGDPALQKGCDQTCHENNVCNIVITEFGQDKICKDLTRKIHNIYSGENVQ